VNLIETALQGETVAAEYSVSRLQYRRERLPLRAAAFTKGCVGVQPQRQERLDNLENKDRNDPNYRHEPLKRNWLSAPPTKLHHDGLLRLSEKNMQ
jgi:hypothetical protein